MLLVQYLIGFSLVIAKSQDQRGIAVCDLSHRDTSCPTLYCCARDDFILEDILCKPYGRLNDRCTTVHSEEDCPCLKGLYCKTDLTSQSFTSVYGHCHNDTIDRAPTTLTPTTTTRVHSNNHPPQIHLRSHSIYVSRDTDVGTNITGFTASDKDGGDRGNIHCTILQLPYFGIKKFTPHSFEIIVKSSLRTLTPQTFHVFIDCEDDGFPQLNNIAKLDVHILIELSPLNTTVPISTGAPEINTTADSVANMKTESTSTKTLTKTVSPSLTEKTLQTPLRTNVRSSYLFKAYKNKH
ncbi:unnamed protein product [Mytilus coruscus]|uniref:Uncharacterized protein n=1 Tax=Mytilus coruscus TaxID=42192 RepID=A0A6J8ER95_MYTCO|nr:unnamed protein product [Mytilus coruscus]